MTKFLSTAKLRVFRMLCAHDVDVRTVGFAVFFRSCRAIQGGFLLLAMLCSYLVNDTWSLPSLSRSTLFSFYTILVQFFLQNSTTTDDFHLLSVLYRRLQHHNTSSFLSSSSRFTVHCFSASRLHNIFKRVTSGGRWKQSLKS